MVDEGLFDKFPCDAIFAYHNEPGFPAGRFGFLPGVIYSSSDIAFITVHGKGGHGAMPHTTVDPIMVAAHLILALQTLVSREVDPNDMAVVTVGSLHSGEAPNVIPGSAELKLTIRARRPEVRAFLRDRITAMAHAQAAVHGARAEVDYHWNSPPCINDRGVTEFAHMVALEAMGESALIPDMAPLQASDDFAFMLDTVPGLLFHRRQWRRQTRHRAGLHGAQHRLRFQRRDLADDGQFLGHAGGALPGVNACISDAGDINQTYAARLDAGLAANGADQPVAEREDVDVVLFDGRKDDVVAAVGAQALG